MERALATVPYVTRGTPIDLALEVGQIIVQRAFKGDVDAMQQRGRKDVSFRKLASHPAVSMSASKLWTSCAVYELSLRWPALRECRHLRLAHLRSVLGLVPSDQRALLVRAEKERWSVSKLAERAASKRRGQGGRPPKPRIVRLLEGVKSLRDASPKALRDKRSLAALSPNEVAAGLKVTIELRQKLATLENVLREAKALDEPKRRAKVSKSRRRHG